MSSYLVTYDIRDPSTPDVYEKLHAAIKSYSAWAHITESCWCILSDKKATEVRDHLNGLMRAQDRLMVLKLANVAAWRNVICRDEWLIWLKERQEDKVLLSSIFKASSDRGFERGRKKIGTGEDFEDSG